VRHLPAIKKSEGMWKLTINIILRDNPVDFKNHRILPKIINTHEIIE
jgi:hypothetical protein